MEINDDLHLESNELEKIESLLFEKYLLNIEEDESLTKKNISIKKVSHFII